MTVLDARQQFAERRFLAHAAREFDALKADVLERFGVDIEIGRAFYMENAGRIFAVVDTVVIDTLSARPSVTRWAR